jgi:hypothetical protein
MRLRMTAATVAGLSLLAAGIATGPAAAGTAVAATTRAAAPAATVAAESGYIDTEPGGEAYDSQGGTPSVTEVSDGQYVVEFPNLSDLTDDGGNFEVTPVQTAHNCAITTFDTGTGGTAIVYVDCYLLGSLTDTYFDLTATRAGSIKHGLLDYAWVSSKNKSYKLSGKDLFNSAHKASTVKHLGTGRYEVTFAGKAKTTDTGTVKVSPYGFGDGNCQAASWHGGSTATSVYVDCFGYGGHRQNREFLLVYARNNNILGRSGLTTASAAASKPKTKTYYPSPQYDSRSGARVRVVRLSLGQYRVHFTGSGGPTGPAVGGDVQVTTIGSTYARCTPYSYSQGSSPSARITCYDYLGGAVNASFSVQWLLG